MVLISALNEPDTLIGNILTEYEAQTTGSRLRR